jgi:hypothetical protein
MRNVIGRMAVPGVLLALALLGCGRVLGGEAVTLELETAAYFSERDLPGETPEAITRGQDGTLDMALNNGCHLRWTAAGELTVTTPEDVTLYWLPAQTLPFALTGIPAGMGPQVEPFPIGYNKMELKEVTRFGKTVILVLALSAPDGSSAEVRWTFMPVRREMNGKLFTGVADGFQLHQNRHFMHKLEYGGIMIPGKDCEGARSFRLACYSTPHGYAEAEFGRGPANLGWWGSTIDGGQVFHLLGFPRGTIWEYLDDEAHDMTLMERNMPHGGVDVRHSLTLGRVSGIYYSPLRYRLYTATALSPQLWIEATRSLKTYYSVKYRIPPTPQRPLLLYRNFWYPNGFENATQDVLPIFADFGFRRLEIGWTYRRGVDAEQSSPWCGENVYNPDGSHKTWRVLQSEMIDTVLPGYGGPAAIRRFVDRAHALNMEVYLWHMTAHGWEGDETFRNHPDWLVYDYHGMIRDGGMPWSLGMFDLSSGFLPYTLDRVRRMQAELGIDGFWLDMYGTGVYESANYARTVTAPTVDQRMDYTRAMREMGLGLYGEGMNTTVIDSYVMNPSGNWKGHEFILYNASPFDMGAMQDPQNALDYFTLMSVQSFPTDRPLFLEPNEKRNMQRESELRYRNQAFNVIDRLIGSQPLGVILQPLGTQWVMDKGGVFIFTTAGAVSIRLPPGKYVVDTLSPQGPFRYSMGKGVVRAEAPARGVMVIRDKSARGPR